MSEISAEEKRRLMRERRQAKMQQGKATDRLNTILSQGSSVNSTNVKSVLDDKALPAAAPQSTPSSSGFQTKAAPEPALASELKHSSESHDDPEVPDISSLMQNAGAAPLNEENDMDAIMQKIFAGATGGDTEPKSSEEATSKLFAEMMKTMGQDSDGIPETPANASYQTKLAAYNAYQQKSWNARFFVVRVMVHLTNFLYHLLSIGEFAASSHSYVRDIRPAAGVGSFMAVFISAEIAIISSYFFILSTKGVLGSSSRNHPISKLLSLASTVLPQAMSFQPIVDTLLVYWGGASIIIGDLMFVVLLFGLTTIFY